MQLERPTAASLSVEVDPLNHQPLLRIDAQSWLISVGSSSTWCSSLDPPMRISASKSIPGITRRMRCYEPGSLLMAMRSDSALSWPYTRSTILVVL